MTCKAGYGVNMPFKKMPTWTTSQDYQTNLMTSWCNTFLVLFTSDNITVLLKTQTNTSIIALTIRTKTHKRGHSHGLGLMNV
ncbi:hypothetical protein GDO86_009962 [Hymenochirus boettgeri]|uniref:Uncharacterized protein n=1 Tax=Hymenochirus boettgeri TaxID=247094 RepID=A0A8T2JNG5_9PIPI|nr:hypothetical protein GDO86_009962 [Hymenochirus boettgeri]